LPAGGDAAKSIANATAAGLKVAELQADVARIDQSGSSELGKALGRISILESQMAVYWKGVGQPAGRQGYGTTTMIMLGFSRRCLALTRLSRRSRDL
jgi:hypothetical protein